jgi:hypothetical protein
MRNPDQSADKEGDQPPMENGNLLVGNRVYVTSYGPFQGLRGTIQEVVSTSDDVEDPFCFFLIALEGVTIPTTIWFACPEVELIGFPAITLQSPTELTNN